jgi:uncharacterized small protein (DUF1192 family)
MAMHAPARRWRETASECQSFEERNMIRKLGAAGFCLLVGMMLFWSQAPTPAQGKKDDQAKQIQQLKKQLADRDQQIQKLEAQISKLKINDAKDDGKIALLQQRIKQLEADLKNKKPDKSATQLRKDLDAANLSIKDKDAQIAALQDKAPKATAELSKEITKLRGRVRELEAVKKAPLVHSVILKLKKADPEQVKIISEEANKTLAKIEGVRGMWIGKPAENATPELAQKGYQLGLVVLLDDSDALQKFLEDPLHKQFNDKMGTLWDRPVVYDIQREVEEPKEKAAP